MKSEGQIHSFTHAAMNTEFELSIAAKQASYAKQAATTTFRELDRIEGLLSRYIEYSDISRINNLAGGAKTIIDPITFHCLEQAQQVKRDTGGAFDIAYASRPSKPLQQLFELGHADYTCRALDGGLAIDLGGIGKGYALDCMRELLADWELEHILLRASHSTMLAAKPPPDGDGWEAGFGPSKDRHEFMLANAALSGSGIAVQGEHIADTRPVSNGRKRYRAWAMSDSGARADALSTAFMNMQSKAIRSYLQTHPRDRAWIQNTPEDKIIDFDTDPDFDLDL